MWDIRVREKNTTETLVDMPLGTKVMSEKDLCKPNTQKDESGLSRENPVTSDNILE